MGKLKNPQESETTTEKGKTYTNKDLEKAFQEGFKKGFGDGFDKAGKLIDEEEPNPEEE